MGSVTTMPCDHSEGVYRCNKYSGIENYLFGYSGTQCFGFASMLSDAVFGSDAPLALHTDYDRLKVGDHVRLKISCHSFIVLTKTDDYITVAECNNDYDSCIITWGRKITREQLEQYSRIYMTRYLDEKSDGTAAVGQTKNAAKIRSAPNFNSSVVAAVQADTCVAIINKQSENWYYIQTLSGISGYINVISLEIIFSA